MPPPAVEMLPPTVAAAPTIEQHGAIGNLHTVALVAVDGAVDWWCVPDFDSPSVFAALLDPLRGGTFRVGARPTLTATQRYLPHTNVLETTHEAPTGRLSVIDFMPVAGPLDEMPLHVRDERIVRLLRADGGPVEVELVWAPRIDYARRGLRIVPRDGGFAAVAEPAAAGTDETPPPPLALSLAGLMRQARVVPAADGQPAVHAHGTLRSGESLALATHANGDVRPLSVDAASHLLRETEQAWQDWVHKEEATGDRAWAAEWSDLVIRAELTLKLLSYRPTGAIAAAPTTSLPEWIGGRRNWDYRYAWIRDASLAAQAFFALGHHREGEAFVSWSEDTAQHGESEWGLRILYDVHGRTDLPERELPHLAGYRHSTPVRIGNEAAAQLQLDVFGELIRAAYEIWRLGGRLPPDVRRFVPHLAQTACRQWNEPDYGIWEVRNGPDRFVYSQAMVWMALDGAVRMVDNGWIRGPRRHWQAVQRRIAANVLDHGYDPDLGAFTQRYGTPALDAANLLLPLLEIVPVEDGRVQATIDRTLERLTEAGLVYRYRTDDGVGGPEGAMGLCTFWLVTTLALSGRLDEAYRIFDGMAARATPLGLFSEQIDPASGRFLGNFPQAYTHLGLITSALYLAYMENRPLPIPAPLGTAEHRGSRKRP